jgi:hypothetical protein
MASPSTPHSASEPAYSAIPAISPKEYCHCQESFPSLSGSPSLSSFTYCTIKITCPTPSYFFQE